MATIRNNAVDYIYIYVINQNTMYQFIICKITCISFFNNNRCKGFNYHLDKTYQECSPLKPI